MRTALLGLFLLASSATAWEFTPNPVCTLFHDEPAVSVRITFDPSKPEPYRIAVTRRGATWPLMPVFSIRFHGARPLTITTDRLSIEDDSTTVSVSDTGFGNVLDGLEFNTGATAFMDGAEVPFALTGVAEAVEKFRRCPDVPGV
ncbi:MAG: hypothetical protein ACKVPY_07370 [Paracoccaceae bacterium]